MAIMGAVLAGAMSAGASITANFDNINLSQSYNGIGWDVMPTTYAGLTWQSTGSVNNEAADNWEVTQINGAFQSYYGTSLSAQSGNQVAYNGGASEWAPSLSVGGSPFLFNGAYFAGWPGSLGNPAVAATQVTVIGLLNNVQQWSENVSINTTSWTFLSGVGTTAVNELQIGSGTANQLWMMDTLSYSPSDSPFPSPQRWSRVPCCCFRLGRAPCGFCARAARHKS